MKKWIILCGTIISAIIALTIYDNYTEKRIHNEKIELGTKNACEWLKNKYGIDVEVVSADVIMEDDIFSMFEGNNVKVTVREGDKEYHVKISGVEENADGYDDYQAEEIEKALIDMIKADISTDFEYDFRSDGMYRQRYRAGDTYSLSEMLSEYDSLYVYCVNTDFEEVPVFDFLRRNITNCTFYSFSSQEILDDFMENSSWADIKKYAPFITGYRVIDFPKRDNECKTFNVENYNDLLYYYPNESIYGKLEKGFNEISESEFYWVNGEYDFVSQAYGIEEDCPDTVVWIPIPDNENDKELYIAFEYDNHIQGKVRKIEKCQIIGDYAVHNSYYSYASNLKIVLLCKE
ncbi:MAG: hypothetical protein K2J40_05515 [Ruminococcus sp.]|nr:hypothetical protein [Ruminococcus sp.]